MRAFGGVLMLAGALGFMTASQKLAESGPLPEHLSVSEALHDPAGRWDLGRYGCATAAFVGLLLALFPKGR